MARVGDWLVPDGESARAGLIIGVRNADGSPPYVIKWQSDGHIALVFPGPYARIVPGSADTDASLVSHAAPVTPGGAVTRDGAAARGGAAATRRTPDCGSASR
jgi:hypothetical protein